MPTRLNVETDRIDVSARGIINAELTAFLGVA
jgi:hypothetical protein